MSNVKAFIKENLNSRSDEPFFVFNVEDVIQKHRKWLELMPGVFPYYAVKANRFPFLLDIMVALGIRFDCASQFEVEEVLSRGAKPSDIIIANPCKTIKFLEFCKKHGTDLMTFDSEEELARINSTFPEARLVLRIKVDDSHSRVRLGLKFGADIEIAAKLLRKAKDMALNVMGIAFHVGSGCHSSDSYMEAIHNAREVFDIAEEMGFNMTLIDIGGGYPGTENCYENNNKDVPIFEEMAELIRKSLAEYFPEQNLTIIGEPGRYYCESAFTLITRIISKNTIELHNEKTVMYYLNDGIYGSFLDAAIDKKVYQPIPLLKNIFQLNLRSIHSSILWGPTCDSYDCIRSDFLMPEMNIGEWLLFEDMGAYSLPYTQFGFNGMPSPTVKIFVSEYVESILMKIELWPKIKSHLADLKWRDVYKETLWYQKG